MKPLNQRDPKWKDILLGFSKTTTIGSHGCTITCLGMRAGLSPDEVNERLKKVNGFAQENLVIWSKIKEAIPWLEFEWRGYQYENARVLQAIKDYGSCLVEVNGQRIGAPKHWVLYTGDQKMNDPWYGNEKSTSYYPPIGYAIIKGSNETFLGKPKEYWLQVEKDREDLLKQLGEIDQNKIRELEKSIESWENFYNDLKEIIRPDKNDFPTMLSTSQSFVDRVGKVDQINHDLRELVKLVGLSEYKKEDFKTRLEALKNENQQMAIEIANFNEKQKLTELACKKDTEKLETEIEKLKEKKLSLENRITEILADQSEKYKVGEAFILLIETIRRRIGGDKK